jgi:hypothetical protein
MAEQIQKGVAAVSDASELGNFFSCLEDSGTAVYAK